MNLDLFQTATFGAPAIVLQLERLSPGDRVMLDVLLEAGYQLGALEDPTVERERLHAASRAGLRWEWKVRVRGKRRGWYRPAHINENSYGRNFNGAMFTWLCYEPRLERPIGGWPKFAETDSASAKRRHW